MPHGDTLNVTKIDVFFATIVSYKTKQNITENNTNNEDYLWVHD